MSANTTSVFTVLNKHAQFFTDILASESTHPVPQDVKVEGDFTRFFFSMLEESDYEFVPDLQDESIPYDHFWRDLDSSESLNSYFRINGDGEPLFDQIDPQAKMVVPIIAVEDALAAGRIEEFLKETRAILTGVNILSWESQIANQHLQ